MRVSYSQAEIVDTAHEVKHELVREALRLTGLPRGLEIVTLADVPARGTGLGSSSAVMVGLLSALYAYQGVFRPPTQLAEEAAQAEINGLGKPIGRQDHYAAAVGGFNLIEFQRGGGVRTEPLVTPPGTRETLTAVKCAILLTGPPTSRLRRAQRPEGRHSRWSRDRVAAEYERHSVRDARPVGHRRAGRIRAISSTAIGSSSARSQRGSPIGRWTLGTNPRLTPAPQAGSCSGPELGASCFSSLPSSDSRRSGPALADLREVPFFVRQPWNSDHAF